MTGSNDPIGPQTGPLAEMSCIECGGALDDDGECPFCRRYAEVMAEDES